MPHRTPALPLHRSPAIAVVFAAMAMGLLGCAATTQRPQQPPKQPVNRQTPQPTRPIKPSPPRLRVPLQAAADLFNHGENDLACEQVERAEQLLREGSPASDAERGRLQQFREACNAN